MNNVDSIYPKDSYGGLESHDNGFTMSEEEIAEWQKEQENSDKTSAFDGFPRC